ncbi:MAG: ROK family protein [Candidatus Marinimicrobia bacterium]|nr:ROK family protein [Candidatus Neomarinimicrobiota bacterium]
MRIGVDVGGTNIDIIGLSKSGVVLGRKRVSTPQGSYPGTVRAIVELIHELEQELDMQGSIGVGIPGVVSAQTGRVKNANSTWLIGHPLDRDLASALGRPVRLANDANCFALSEAVDGSGAGADVVFGVILGTGVGGGLVVGGRIISGRNQIAGEWGHLSLPWPDPDEYPGEACYCGLRGCIETFLSGPAFIRSYQAPTGKIPSAAEIVTLAGQGDARAEAALVKYEDRLAKALALMLNIIDPDVIVLGGGLSQIERLYENVPAKLVDHAFSDTIRTSILPPKHGDASGVRGAAWLWPPGSSDA